MKIKNLSYKVEFQGRGAGHIHGVLWANLSRLEDKDECGESQFKHISSAFKKTT